MHCMLVLRPVFLQMQKVKTLLSSKLCSDSHRHRLSPLWPLLTEISALSRVLFLLQISPIADSPYAEKNITMLIICTAMSYPMTNCLPSLCRYVYNCCTDTYTTLSSLKCWEQTGPQPLPVCEQQD